MWLTYLVVFAVSFSTLILARPIANKIGLVDKPNYRKRHQGFIPLIGGIALFLGDAAFYLLQWDQMRLPWLYLGSVLLLLIVGMFDDRYDISAFIRAIVQTFLALLMVYIGDISLTNLGQLIGPFSIRFDSFSGLGLIGVVLTVLITIGVINAFNMIDGIDGLLAGLSSVTFAGIGVLMWLDNQLDLALWSFAMIVVLIPYVLFNLNVFGVRWKVFMGDSGSTIIGFTIIWMLLMSTQSQGHPITPITGLWLIAVPVVDMFAVILRRLKKGKSPFRPDRLHVHHLMVRAGLNHRQALAVITLFAACCALFGILGQYYYINGWLMFGSFILLFCAYTYSITRAWRITRFIRRMKRRKKVSQQRP